MAVTGDWTMVAGEGGDGDGSVDHEHEPTAAADPSAGVTVTADPPNANANANANGKSNHKTAALRFPCLEQPPRFALRSSGPQPFYLGGTKKGHLVGRQKCTENDEWTIAFAATPETAAHSSSEASDSHSSNGTTSIVTIHNHKFGSALSLIHPVSHQKSSCDMGRTVACVSLKQQEEQKNRQEQQQQQQHENQKQQQQQQNSIAHDLGLGETNANANATDAGETEETTVAHEQLPDDEDQDPDQDPTNYNYNGADQEDMQWCVIRCSEEECPNGGVTIMSLKTGDSLGMSETGKVILVPSNNEFHHESGNNVQEQQQQQQQHVVIVWQMECVTGELCFLSNPAIDARVRCDMTGLLTLSPNWKGWEVVRITEVAAPYSSNSNSNSNKETGYVRISSWMHSQWFLCSDSTGTVSACHVTDSLLSDNGISNSNSNSNSNDDSNSNSNNSCSKWAIEKYPTDEGNKHKGVIIRSATHGRLLSIRDGVLRTFDSLEGIKTTNLERNNSNSNSNINNEESPNDTSDTSITTGDNKIGDMVKQHTDEMKRKSSQWWKQSLTNVQKTLSDSAIHRRNSKMLSNGETPVGMSLSLPGSESLRQEDTILWQMEAAHLQTYYFLSTTTAAATAAAASEIDPDTDNGKTESIPTKPRSIGAFPSVTENLRKSDKIQLVRNDETSSPDTLKLYLPDEKFFVGCSSRGSVFATKNDSDGDDEKGTEWILEEQSDGSSVFRSKAHGLYLSLRDESTKAPPPAAFEAAVAAADEELFGQHQQDAAGPRTKKLKNPFENLKLPPLQKPKAPIAELCATETPMTFWNLEPCTPRAISSKRIRTFAIGTSIAVGTTIAMPFALAGVAAAMGALGAEAGIGFGIVAAAATGAEAFASVGAIGVTAYFCFRPETNSLGDDIEDIDPNHHSNPWSKRPFSNWRNW